MDNQIDQFVELTGTSREIAKNYLQVSDGNLDTAVSLFLESDGNLLNNQASYSGAASASQNNNRGSNESNYPDLDQVRAPIASKRERLVDDDLNFSGFRYNHGYRSGNTNSAAVDPFRDFASEAMYYTQGFTSNDNDQPSSLSDLYRPPIDIIYHGDFERAKSYAEATKKWLLVNIQSVDSFECQILNRDVWGDKNIKNVVKKNFLFCQYITGTESAEQFKQFYHVDKYPHVSIIDPRTGERMRFWGPKINSEAFLEEITDFVYTHPYSGKISLPSSKSKKKVDILTLTEEELLRETIKASVRESGAQGSSSKPRSNNYKPYDISSDSEDYIYDSFDSGNEELINNNSSYDEISKNSTISISDSEDSGVVSSTSGTVAHHPAASLQNRTDVGKRSNSNSLYDLAMHEIDHDLNKNLGVGSEPVPTLPDSHFTIDMIPAAENVEPVVGNESTRIQFRFPDGSRKVRRFLKTDTVMTIFSFIKSTLSLEERNLAELTFNRANLWNKLDVTIQDADLCNSSIVVDY